MSKSGRSVDAVVLPPIFDRGNQMNRLALFAITSLFAHSALANMSTGPAKAPFAATSSQEAACPASQRAHVTQVNVNADGSYAHSAVLKMDQSGKEIVIAGPDRPKVGWFMCNNN
jgi:hypothetical protein